jgi:hypothetical protein
LGILKSQSVCSYYRPRKRLYTDPLPPHDPVSDNEEDEVVNEPLSEQLAIQSEQARHKRARSRSLHSQVGEDDDQYL